MPPLICAAPLASSLASALADALEEIDTSREAAMHLEALGVRRFAPVARADYAVLGDLDRVALEAGYTEPS